jgi:hypothetical protein
VSFVSSYQTMEGSTTNENGLAVWLSFKESDVGRDWDLLCLTTVGA